MNDVEARAAHDFLLPVFDAEIARLRDAVGRVLAAHDAQRAGGRAPAKRANASAAAAPAAQPDDEAVHDLRVSLRRLRTALRPARRVYGKRRLEPVERALRHHARASGALRDEEVLRETMSALVLAPRVRADVTAWLARRRAKERARRKALVESVRADDGARFRARGSGPPEDRVPSVLDVLVNLSRLFVPKGRAPAADELGARALAAAAEAVIAASAVDPEDTHALHALRICFKRLRYTVELLAPLYGERAARIGASAAALQKQLGAVHDLDQAAGFVRRARSLPRSARAALLPALAARRARVIARAMAELAGALVVVRSVV
ncbi:MAG TPA: CHAD domain-containing protein [Byssovorax sp.]|jgi:CHAD domain-containing protein